MFDDDASARTSRLASKRLADYRRDWIQDRHWFDGSPDSVDRRIAKIDKVIRFARATVAAQERTKAGFECHAALPQLERDRRELAALRDGLLLTADDHSDGEHSASPDVGALDLPDLGAPNREASRRTAAAMSYSDFAPELMFDG